MKFPNGLPAPAGAAVGLTHGYIPDGGRLARRTAGLVDKPTGFE